MKSLNGKIIKDIEICEENIANFPSDNKYIQAIQRSLNRIKKILSDLENGKLENSAASIIRHDLKNPLAAAFGFADLLKLKLTTKKDKQYAENISKSLRNILDQVNMI